MLQAHSTKKLAGSCVAMRAAHRRGRHSHQTAAGRQQSAALPPLRFFRRENGRIRRFAVLPLLLCGILLAATGCGSPKATSSSSISGTLVSNPFASTINASNVSSNSSAGNVETYAAFGYGIDAVKSYTYSGNPITCNYYLEYSGPKEKEEFGNILFLDGIVQPFSVDGDGENIYFYKYTVDMNEKKTMTFSITPVTGKNGDSKLVTIGTFWNPSYLSTEDSPQFTTKSQSFRTKNKALSYTADAPEQILQGVAKQTTASINKTSMGWFGIYSKDMDTISENKAANTYENNLKDTKKQINFQLFTSSKPAQDDNRYAAIKTAKDKKLTLYLEGFGGYDSSIGKTVKCRTTVFIDNQPVKTTAGDDYIETTMSNDKLSVQSFSLDLSGLSSGNHALYAVSIPISGYQYVSDQMGYSTNSMATKTETHLLVIE